MLESLNVGTLKRCNVVKVAKNCGPEISRLANKWFNLFRFCYIKDCHPPINSGTELCIHTTSLVVSYACLGLGYLLLCHWKKDLEKSEKSQRKHTLDLSLFTKHHLQHVHENPNFCSILGSKMLLCDCSKVGIKNRSSRFLPWKMACDVCYVKWQNVYFHFCHLIV